MTLALVGLAVKTGNGLHFFRKFSVLSDKSVMSFVVKVTYTVAATDLCGGYILTDSATPESTYEVVRNRKTGKLFLILDDALEDRYQLITPSGDTKILPSVLFDGDPVTVRESELLPEQIQALRDRERRLVEGERITEERQRHQIEAPKREPAAVKTPRRRSPKQPERGPSGVMSTWKSDRLTFYRHKISPLKFNQKFRIEFYNGGAFEISKGDFESAFNDVVMSPSYRSEGHFSYPDIPDKARKYFKN